jgi:methylmalonyl-CoA mutase
LAEASHDENENTNMIRSTTQAMAAVIGGANRLVVRSANNESNTFTRRIARNVQHLLKMESYLDRVVDPAAGSYYIEALTNQLAEKAWGIFQAKV